MKQLWGMAASIVIAGCERPPVATVHTPRSPGTAATIAVSVQPSPVSPRAQSCAESLTGLSWGASREALLRAFPNADQSFDVDCVESFDFDGMNTRMCFIFSGEGLDRIILVARACDTGTEAAAWQTNTDACHAAYGELSRRWQRRKNAAPDQTNESGQLHWQAWREPAKGGSRTRLLHHHETLKPVGVSLECARMMEGD